MGGKSSSQTVGYRYFVGVHMVLCAGPIDYLIRILVDNDVAWAGKFGQGTININQWDLFGGDSQEGGLQGNADICLGGPDQQQNGYLLSRLAGLVPAFRGVVSVILNQMYMGLNPYLKQWSFRATRIHVRQNGIPQWYDAKAAIATSSQISPGFGPLILQSVYLNADSGSFSLPNPVGIGNLLVLFMGGQEAEQGVSALPTGFAWQGNSGFFPGLNVAVATAISTVSPIITTARQFAEAPDYGVLMEIGGAADFNYYTSDDTSSYSGDAPNGVIVTPEYPSTANPSLYLTMFGILRPDGDMSASTFSSPYINDDGTTDDPAPAVLLKQWSVPPAWPPADSRSAAIALVQASDYYVNTYASSGQINPNGSMSIGIKCDAVPQVGGGVGYQSPIATMIFTGQAIIQTDMNPAHIIRECLTDPDWGMGYAEADIDNVSFTAAADQLYTEGLGCSKLWNSESTIEDLISEICQLINASIYVSRSTGLFVLKLIRNDYTLADLITLDPSNVDNVTDFVSPKVGSLANQVVVTYWDAGQNQNGTVTAQDIAMIAAEGTTISQAVTYDGCTNAGLASQLAQRDLKTLSTPLISASIETNLVAAGLNIGDCFIWTWPDYKVNQVVMRVTGIGFGDSKNNAILIKCAQDVFGPLPPPSVASNTTGWISSNGLPTPVTQQLFFEAPYVELVRVQGQATTDSAITATPEIGYAAIAAAKPTAGGLSANFYDNLGAGMVQVSNLDFCPNAKLSANVGIFDASFVLSNPQYLNEVVAGTWFQVDGEIMAFQSVASDGVTVSVLRGCFDTIAAAHSAGAVCFFWDGFSSYDDTQLVSGEAITGALCTVTGSGVLPISSATVASLTIVGRAGLPYPPASPMINGTRFDGVTAVSGAFTVSWKERNRLTQQDQVIDQTQATVTPEINTRYFLGFYDATNTLLVSENNIGTPTASVTLNYTGNVTAKLYSISGNGNSMQEWSFTFAYTPPTGTPTNTITATAYVPAYAGTIIDGGSA